VELQHRFSVPVGIEEAWTAFNDLERIAPCFPGAEITSVDGDEFTGLAKVKLGPISLQYTGTGRWRERDRAGFRAVIEASGKDKRGNGTASATIRAQLEEEGAGTAVVLDTDLKITGRPAQFGRGVLQDVGNKLLDQFAACLASTLGVDAGASSPAEQLAEQRESAAEQAAVAGQRPAAETSGPAPGSPPPPGSAAPPGPSPAARVPAAASSEVDLGSLVGPVLLRQYGPVLAAVVVTAVVTWIAARRHR
jgi:uncharacterized protein